MMLTDGIRLLFFLGTWERESRAWEHWRAHGNHKAEQEDASVVLTFGGIERKTKNRAAGWSYAHWSNENHEKPWSKKRVYHLMLNVSAMLKQVRWRCECTWSVSGKSLEVAEGPFTCLVLLRGRHPGRGGGGGGGGWVIPYCATAHPSGVQECCTPRSFWLCPCCCWARCLWWCHTGDKTERSPLDGRKHVYDQPPLVVLHKAPTLSTWHPSDRGSSNTLLLTCPHDKYHHDDDELPCPQLRALTHFLHRHFVCWGWEKTDIYSSQEKMQNWLIFYVLHLKYSPGTFILNRSRRGSEAWAFLRDRQWSARWPGTWHIIKTFFCKTLIDWHFYYSQLEGE